MGDGGMRNLPTSLEPPADPCLTCRLVKVCRLPLNCDRYLQYKRALQQKKEDEEGLRRCQKFILTTPEPVLRSIRERNERAAKECPWIIIDFEIKGDELINKKASQESKVNQESTNATRLRVQPLLAMFRPDASQQLSANFNDVVSDILREWLETERLRKENEDRVN